MARFKIGDECYFWDYIVDFGFTDKIMVRKAKIIDESIVLYYLKNEKTGWAIPREKKEIFKTIDELMQYLIIEKGEKRQIIFEDGKVLYGENKKEIGTLT